MFSLKVTNLTDVGTTFILLICRKENEKQLLSDWAEMLGAYPILCDLRTNVTPAIGHSLESIEKIEKMYMSAFSQPIPSVGNIARHAIFVGKKYFDLNSDHKKAVLLHELGHFYVYEKGILEKLRQNWDKGEQLFGIFIKPLELQNGENISSYRKWVKDFYDAHVFDLLKIPGEYYADLWVKENFGDVFGALIESRYYETVFFWKEGLTKYQKGLVVFPLFSLILRLSTFILLIEDATNLTRFGKLKKDLLYELIKYTTKSGFEFLREIEEETIRLTTSSESTDKLIDTLEKYVKSFPIKVDPSTKYK